MRHRRRSVSYAGEPFCFEQVKDWEGGGRKVVWSVTRRGEFIGTMTTPQEITTNEFDVTSTGWLTELLGRSPPDHPSHGKIAPRQ
jgi:hypothetical protein